eukprot:4644141-Pleurochrysis_carterae.AAC.1
MHAKLCIRSPTTTSSPHALPTTHLLTHVCMHALSKMFAVFQPVHRWFGASQYARKSGALLGLAGFMSHFKLKIRSGAFEAGSLSFVEAAIDR